MLFKKIKNDIVFYIPACNNITAADKFRFALWVLVFYFTFFFLSFALFFTLLPCG